MSGVAPKRLAKSAVDWTKFAAVCPKSNLEMLRATKAKHEAFLNKVHALPENLPKIDFAGYKNRLKDPGMADRFEKAYAALKIPYPVDKDNLMKKVEADRNERDEEVKKAKVELQGEIELCKTFLDKMKTLPALEEMTQEMMYYYFPESAPDPKRPMFWPHDPEKQPYNPNFKYLP